MKKFLIYYVLLMSLLSGLVSYQIWKSYSNHINRAKTSLLHEGGLVEQSIIASLAAIEGALVHIAKDIGKNPLWLRSYPMDDLAYSKTLIAETLPIGLAIVDIAGKTTLSSTKFADKSLQSAEAKSFWAKVTQGSQHSLFVSGPIYAEESQQWKFLVARQINHWKSHKLLGVVLAVVNVEYFSKFRTQLDVDKDNLFSVMLGDQPKFAYRYPSSANSEVGSVFSPHPLLEPLVRGDVNHTSNIFNSKIDGSKRILAGRRVGQFPILVFMGKNYGEYIKSWAVEASVVIGLTAFLGLGLYASGKQLIRFSETIVRQQEQLITSSKLTALGEMAAAMSHEINNPLAIIAGHAQLIKARLRQETINNKTIHQSVDSITQTVERISKIIIGLKNFSRSSDSQPSNVMLSKVIEDVMGICQERLKNAGIEIQIEVLNPDLILNIDPIQFEQVLLNLFNNSFDAIAPLPSKWIRLQVMPINNKLRILFIDSGEGIPPQVAKRIMEPFFSTKPEGQGTGLGLSISKGIIEKFGGKFWLDNRAKNTTFVVELPLIAKAERT